MHLFNFYSFRKFNMHQVKSILMWKRLLHSHLFADEEIFLSKNHFRTNPLEMLIYCHIHSKLISPYFGRWSKMRWFIAIISMVNEMLPETKKKREKLTQMDIPLWTYVSEKVYFIIVVVVVFSSFLCVSKRYRCFISSRRKFVS